MFSLIFLIVIAILISFPLRNGLSDLVDHCKLTISLDTRTYYYIYFSFMILWTLLICRAILRTEWFVNVDVERVLGLIGSSNGSELKTIWMHLWNRRLGFYSTENISLLMSQNWGKSSSITKPMHEHEH